MQPSRIARGVLLASLFTCFSTSIAASPQRGTSAGRIIVANRASGTVSVIDARTEQVQGTFPLPGPNLAEPMYFVSSPKEDLVWVGDRANNAIHALSTSTFAVDGSVPAGNGVFHMWADEAMTQLWVVNDIDQTASVIDPLARTTLQTVPMPPDLLNDGGLAHDVILDGNGSAYISFNSLPNGEDVVVKFSTTTFAEVDRATVGDGPHIALARGKLYAACQDTNEVIVLDTSTLDQLTSIPVPGAHGIIGSFARNRMYVANLPGGGADAIWTIDTVTDTLTSESHDTSFAVPHNLAVSRDGAKLFVTQTGATSDKVSVFRVRRSDVKGGPTEVTVELNPYGIAAIP